MHITNIGVYVSVHVYVYIYIYMCIYIYIYMYIYIYIYICINHISKVIILLSLFLPQVFVPMMKLMARCCEQHPQPFYMGLVRSVVGRNVIQVCMYIYIYIYVCMCIHIYTYMYIYIHML